MHGNVWEWCENWYDEKEERKVLFGGSWLNYSGDSRCAFRLDRNPTIRFNSSGFRLLGTFP